MPPPIRTSRATEDSGLDYVGRGFWFALGFTPVFIVLTTLATYAYFNILAQHAESEVQQFLSGRHVPQAQRYDSLVDQATAQALTIQREATQLLVPKWQNPSQLCSEATKEYLTTRRTSAQQRMYEYCNK